jgi:uncharacterized OB-fold protein
MSEGEQVLGLPAERTQMWAPVTEAAEAGRFVLQVCEGCERVQYPPREVCANCLSDDLQWSDIDAVGRVIAHTHLHASLESHFNERLPWPIGSVKLDCGPVVIAHFNEDTCEADKRVRLLNLMDLSGQGVFVAIAEGADASALDPKLQELCPSA